MADSVLVTGGSGFIGSHLVKRLLEEKYSVRVLDNSWRGTKRNLGDKIDDVEFIEADVRDIEKMREATKDVGTVYHLASIQGTGFFYSHPDTVLEVGILGNMNMAKAASENGVSRIVYTSSSEVYGIPEYFPTDEKHPMVIPDITNPRWSYSAQKIIGESIFLNYARKYDFDATIIRPHNIYGPGMGWNHVVPEFIKRIVLKEKFTVQGTGKETRSFCYIDDMVAGLVMAGTKDEGKNQIFNIGNADTEVTINQLIEELQRVSGQKIDPVHVEKLEGSTDRRKPDISKAQKLLGYSPKVSLGDGLEKTYSWYQKEIEFILESGDPTGYPWEKK